METSWELWGTVTANQWTPSNIVTALWLDASDTNTVLRSGSSVTNWLDKSGNGKNLTQVTLAKQPTYTASGLNGSNVVSFGGSQYLVGGVIFANATNLSVICALRYKDATTSDQAVYNNDVIQTAPSVLLKPEAGTLRLYGGSYTNAGSYTNNQVEINGVSRGPSSGYTGNMWRNGTQVLINAAMGAAANNNGFYVGYLGGVVNWYGKFDMAELIALDGEVSASDRQKLEGYLAWKWGLTNNLPTNHPYKVSAP